MATKSGPFIVIYGGEDFGLDRVISRRKQVWAESGRDIELLDGARTSEPEVLNRCETHSFFEETRRAVILDNAQDLKLQGDLSRYVESRDPKDSSVILMVVFRSESVPKEWAEVATAMGRKGDTAAFQKLKPWEADQALGRVTEEAKQLGLKLEPGVAEFIYKCLGDNLRSTVNELQKLTYLAEAGVVKKEHAELVVVRNIPANPSMVARAAAERNRQRAMSLTSLLYTYMGAGASVPITAALMRQVEELLVARQMLDKGDSPGVVAVRFGMHEFACRKNLIPLTQKHTVPALLGHMQRLCKLDGQVKGSARSKRTLVELAVLSIAGA